jgi:hypothetical protein
MRSMGVRVEPTVRHGGGVEHLSLASEMHGLSLHAKCRGRDVAHCMVQPRMGSVATAGWTPRQRDDQRAGAQAQ